MRKGKEEEASCTFSVGSVASSKVLVGIILMVIGTVVAASARLDVPDTEGTLYERVQRLEILDTTFTIGVILAGLGTGIAITAIGVRLGPQFKSMNYCPFCGLEKAPPYAICERCGKKFEY